MRILGESFKMNAGYLAIGYTGTDMSGSFFYLPKIVGYERAFRIMSSPDRWDAETLHSWGFGLEVVPDDEVVAKAVELAHHLCDTTAPMALRLTKESIHAAIDGTSFETQVKMREPQPSARCRVAGRRGRSRQDESPQQAGCEGASREVRV